MIVALPDLREWGNTACNTGTPRKVIEQTAEDLDLPIDLNLVPDGWEVNRERDNIKCDCCKKDRAGRVKADLCKLRRTLVVGGVWKGITFERAEKDVHVAIVSHGAFLYDLLHQKGKPSVVMMLNVEALADGFGSGQKIRNTDIMSFEVDEKVWVMKSWYLGAFTGL